VFIKDGSPSCGEPVLQVALKRLDAGSYAIMSATLRSDE
jgi:hypothetical protein